MDAIKAGIEKVKETVYSKKADEQAAKAHNPFEAPSDRVDAAFEAGKSARKAEEHSCKAECHKDKHASS
jgi:hypothetical protein